MSETFNGMAASNRVDLSEKSILNSLQKSRDKTACDLMTGVLFANRLLVKPPPELPKDVPEHGSDDSDADDMDMDGDFGDVELGEVAVTFNLLASKFPISQELLPPIVLRSQLYTAIGDRTLVDRELVCCPFDMT